MARTSINEVTEHDQLVFMMARHFKQLGYTDIKADIPGWTRPDSIYWINNPNNKYYPDLTCFDLNRVLIILEAETYSTFNDQHTQDQFKIFRAHADNNHGRFEVVVPRLCSNQDGRTLISQSANRWGIIIDNIWTPSN